MSAIPAFLGVIMVALAAGLGVFLVITLAGKVFRGIGWLLRHVFGFIGGMAVDLFRFVGAIFVSPMFMVLSVGSVVLGRWSAAAHYGRAVQTELKTAGLCVYRFFVGRPMRFIGLGPVLDGYERRLPEVVAQAPGRDKPRGRQNQFEGYTVVGSLPGGGSGGKLYIAEPDAKKRAAFDRKGIDVDQVVIKTFSLHEGSSLPQILRESRALDAAKKLGLVLEHELLDNDRFFYVMRYVPGKSLTEATRELHGSASAEGLTGASLQEAIGFVADLVRTLEHYHSGGLWHKDVKPDNVIVHDGRAELVDFGLITPLRSAMTLTTHGTEYFRDPELVRMALRGVKVHEVNGAKFDIYATGAVLFSVIENSFPAHGGLSQVSKNCPDAIKWIIRRAMTDYDKRYETAGDMLADLETVMAADDPFAVKPAALPSMQNGGRDEANAVQAGGVEAVAVAASPVPPIPPSPAAPPPFPPDGRGGQAAAGAGVGPAVVEAAPRRRKPKIRVVNWWSGRYAVETEYDQDPAEARVAQAAAEAVAQSPAAHPERPVRRRPTGSAREQVRAARKRAAQRRANAAAAIKRRRRSSGAGGNVGIGIAVVATLGVLVASPFVISGVSHLSASEAVEDAKRGVAEAFTETKSLKDVAGALVIAREYREVLVVNDLPLPVEKPVRNKIRALVEDGYVRGFWSRGLLEESYYPGQARDEIDVAGDIELLSKARFERADRPLDDVATLKDLQAWIGETAGVDALLWIYDEPGGRADGLSNVRVLSLGPSHEAYLLLEDLEGSSWDQLAEEIGPPAASAIAVTPDTPATPGDKDAARRVEKLRKKLETH